jgi:hypothetical protein
MPAVENCEWTLSLREGTLSLRKRVSSNWLENEVVVVIVVTTFNFRVPVFLFFSDSVLETGASSLAGPDSILKKELALLQLTFQLSRQQTMSAANTTAPPLRRSPRSHVPSQEAVYAAAKAAHSRTRAAQQQQAAAATSNHNSALAGLVDARFEAQAREIAQLRTDVADLKAMCDNQQERLDIHGIIHDSGKTTAVIRKQQVERLQRDVRQLQINEAPRERARESMSIAKAHEKIAKAHEKIDLDRVQVNETIDTNTRGISGNKRTLTDLANAVGPRLRAAETAINELIVGHNNHNKRLRASDTPYFAAPVAEATFVRATTVGDSLGVADPYLASLTELETQAGAKHRRCRPSEGAGARQERDESDEDMQRAVGMLLNGPTVSI